MAVLDVMANTPEIPESNAPRRKVVLVCGMHRSGTSALAGALKLLGVAAPKTLVPAHSSNPRGHWESAPLVDLFETMLTDVGSSHLDWRAVNREWFNSDSARRYRQSIKSVIASEFEDSSLFFIKDPRICRFMPLMIETIQELNIQPYIVLPLRNPLEVANSLARRNGLPVAESLLVWLRHVLEAEHHSRSLPRSFIEYHVLVSDWRAVLKPLFEKMNVMWPDLETIAHEVDEFLEPDLRHENIPANDLATNDSTTFWVKKAYRCFTALSEGKRSKSLLNDLSSLKSDFDIACEAFDLGTGQIHHSVVDRFNFEEAKLHSPFLAAGGESRGLAAGSADQRLAAASEDLRRLVGEVAQRDRRLGAADSDLRRLRREIEDREQRLKAADADLRRLMGEIEDREQRLKAADGDLRRL
ncbi:hypothetical protein, partial [uncultured Bradyrhizobium sp.]|uniref:sulfotransferase family protein n=1 Tax=uncultured Bradyrhizobium sp. TaxID=199684 RepID=UPI0035CB7DF8